MKITLARESGSKSEFCRLGSQGPRASHFSLGLSLFIWRLRSETKELPPHFLGPIKVLLAFFTAR